MAGWGRSGEWLFVARWWCHLQPPTKGTVWQLRVLHRLHLSDGGVGVSCGLQEAYGRRVGDRLEALDMCNGELCLGFNHGPMFGLKFLLYSYLCSCIDGRPA